MPAYVAPPPPSSSSSAAAATANWWAICYNVTMFRCQGLYLEVVFHIQNYAILATSLMELV